jgi:hypothetical protein
MTRKALDAARAAGRALRETPNADLPEEAVADPAAACPFPVGDEQRAAWLEGYLEADEQATTSSSSIRKALEDHVDTKDAAR